MSFNIASKSRPPVGLFGVEGVLSNGLDGPKGLADAPNVLEPPNGELPKGLSKRFGPPNGLLLALGLFKDCSFFFSLTNVFISNNCTGLASLCGNGSSTC